MNLDEYRDVLSNKLMSETYDMALRVIMEIENLPKEFAMKSLEKATADYEKAKAKDKDLAKFLLGLIYIFTLGNSKSFAVPMVVMAYLGIDSVGEPNPFKEEDSDDQ
mgnify:CR=1 FL=1